MKTLNRISLLVAALLLPMLSHAFPFETTTEPDAQDTHWYQLKTLNRYVYANNETFSAIYLSNQSKNVDECLWCFVATESGKVVLYNRMRKAYIHSGNYFKNSPDTNVNYVQEGNGDEFYIRFVTSDNYNLYLVYGDEYNSFYGSSIPENTYTVIEQGVCPPPVVTCDIFPDRGVISVTGKGNKQITLNGQTIQSPYTIMRTGEDQHFVVNAVATESGKPSGSTSKEFTVPRIQKSGDVTGDNHVDISDINAIINMMLEIAPKTAAGDVTGDGSVDISDVNKLVNIMLGMEVSDTAPVMTTYTVNGVSFSMVKVEGGTYVMGKDRGAHNVTLSSFSIGQTEVTQELWYAVMGKNPSYFNSYGNSTYGSYHNSVSYGTNLQRPVESVSWEDCQEFITKLNELTGLSFRMPTEAEWEYAALGGNKSHGYTYAGSNDVDMVAWYMNNSFTGLNQYDPNSGFGVHVVATKHPNELWLYDMSGNVSEWCQDWYTAFYDLSDQTNPTGPETGDYRIRRGGSFNVHSDYCRATGREATTPTRREHHVGLRLVLTETESAED
ncbi:MAG: SUMF1/EgtB/PvdO family nonheme iron enzyme [Muribaculaceae bacterium]|nr:SUMF1/EgtB/PvdO family nonheme iron enzyme [Muribaculaceae bacterium]